MGRIRSVLASDEIGIMDLPEKGSRNEFKRAILDYLFHPDIRQEFCAHDWDIVSINEDPTPVYCCNRCDKVGGDVVY